MSYLVPIFTLEILFNVEIIATWPKMIWNKKKNFHVSNFCDTPLENNSSNSSGQAILLKFGYNVAKGYKQEVTKFGSSR